MESRTPMTSNGCPSRVTGRPTMSGSEPKRVSHRSWLNTARRGAPLEASATHALINDITPALPLFAQLRRFTLAVLAAAETAADFAGVLQTDAPPNGEAEDGDQLRLALFLEKVDNPLPDLTVALAFQ